MGKENVTSTHKYYSVIKKEGDLVICYNIDGPWVYYAKWNKSNREKTSSVWSHLYVESKNQNQA